MIAAGDDPCLLLVEPDLAMAEALLEWLKPHARATIHVATARDATVSMHDAAFVEARFDGLLLDVNLPDSTGYRVMSAFRDEFPGRPVAAMSASDNLCLRLWCKARAIPVFRKPFDVSELEGWLTKVRETMRPMTKLTRNRGGTTGLPSRLVRHYALGF
jgi:CheY-like chemotaxis protein